MNHQSFIKFRSLSNDFDLERASNIIKTGTFWCSKLWNLNDPMEGIYKIERKSKNFIKNVFNEKNKYVICSFSHPDALKCPLLWGYYANGFKGIAIEVNFNEILNSVHNINYVPFVKAVDYNEDYFDTIEIITTKLDYWEHEKEYRYIKESEKAGPQQIGQITKVYFGTPYKGITNKKDITEKSETLREYNYLKNELKLICKEYGIATEDFKLKL